MPDANYREPFDTLGDFLASVVAASIGERDDHRLERAAVAGLEEGIPSRGGFLVPQEHAGGLHERIYETGSIIARCTPWPATKEKFIVPVVDERSRADGSRFGGVTMSWTAPGDAITASKPKFAAREMNRRSLKGLIYTTNEMLSDVPTLEATFARLFSLEGSFIVEREIVTGTGAGQPLGILNSGATISVSAESGQSAATIVAANVVNMFARMWSPSKRRAVWLINGAISPQLYGLTWSTGTGVVPLFRWGEDGTPLLMGRPVIEVEYASALGSKGDIILADLGEYLIASPEEISLAFSGDLKFINDESAFRFRMRVDGHPAWSSPTTPLNGGSTVSPFVTLEART